MLNTSFDFYNSFDRLLYFKSMLNQEFWLN